MTITMEKCMENVFPEHQLVQMSLIGMCLILQVLGHKAKIWAVILP